MNKAPVQSDFISVLTHDGHWLVRCMRTGAVASGPTLSDAVGRLSSAVEAS